ncbi:MAG: (2Fe-2S)-binding protein [Deltaproteobacteria bacterium]|nr:(2Fe-2S)-binding protein [Deltaproteobacteria bacterium]
MKKEIAHFNVNGRQFEVLVTPNMTLSELLREQLDLTGTKNACGVGECGSCTVLVDGQPALSCSTLAIAVRDKEIMTIEGLSRGSEIHPLQQAFIESGAIQCGFCTPGMIMTSEALMHDNPHPTREDVKEGLGGNLCRCTGYVKIIDAVMSAAETMGKGGN